jgi:ribosomal protein S18 acetylase RimI-like enzyme
MLVGVIDGEPCGRIWIDLRQGREAGAGIVWAFRVHPDFQRLGVGSRLLLAAEAAIRRHGLAASRLIVDAGNRGALRLYGRFGYLPSGRSRRRLTYTTHDGEHVDDTVVLVQMVKSLGPERKRSRSRPPPRRAGWRLAVDLD